MKLDEENLLCPKCEEVKPRAEFAKNKNKPRGVASWCKLCTNVSVKAWFQREGNKDRHKQKLYTRRVNNKQRLVDYYGDCCGDCGGTFPSFCYDFHHLDGSTKEKSFANMSTNSWASIEKEIIGKCVMLCANCHRIRHYE